MIAHQRVCKHLDSPEPMRFGNDSEERLIVSIVGERRPSPRTTVHDVIDRFGKLYT